MNLEELELRKVEALERIANALGNENKFKEIENKIEEAKKVAVETGVPIITATQQTTFIKLCEAVGSILKIHSKSFEGKVYFKIPNQYGYRMPKYPDITMRKNTREIFIKIKDTDAFGPIPEDQCMNIVQLNGILAIAKTFNSPGLHLEFEHANTKTISAFQVIDFEYKETDNIMVMYTIRDRQHDTY